MADFAKVTVEVRRPGASVRRYTFTAEQFTQKVDADDVMEISFPGVTDWQQGD